MIRPPSGLNEAGPAQKLLYSTKVNQARTCVQPSRTNKGNKMAEILDEMEVDDGATTSLPGRRKRRIEDDPEQFFTVPDDVGQNPMVPVKRLKQDASVRPLDIPPQLPLQPTLPEQIPPPSRSFQPPTRPTQQSALPEQIPPIRSSQPQTQPPQSTDGHPQLQHHQPEV